MRLSEDDFATIEGMAKNVCFGVIIAELPSFQVFGEVRDWWFRYFD